MEDKMESEAVVENSEENTPATDKEVPKSTQEDPEEELLGSLTTYNNNNEGSENKTQQLRTSARVYKKMKLDSVSLPPVDPEPEKKEEPVVVEEKIEHKKSFRILWTSHDKDLFFEALNEYGKDFENIYSFIVSKSKRKGLPENFMKTKDQVRHLYYRTWHKISKYVRFSEGIKKVAQELYALINYGEMRRKVRFVTQKLCCKLQDLIYRGAIAIRDRGKTIRIKTPMCRALRRLNQLDERYDELKLPSRIVLELKPKNMYAYLKVQSMAQNPRLRTTVPLQKRLSSVIVSVSKKWKTVEADIYDKAIISKNSITNDCVPTESESNGNKLLLSPLLRFTPPSDTEIEIPSINLSEYFTRQTICLRAYETKLGIKSSDSLSIPLSDSHLRLMHKNLLKKAMQAEADNTQTQENNQPLAAVKDVVSSIIYLQNALEGHSKEVKEEIIEDKHSEIEEKDNLLQKQAPAKIAEVRKGWTLSDCAGVSIGDLYLMFGKHAKLVLEYNWDDPQKNQHENCKASEQVEDSNTLANAQNDLNSEQDIKGVAEQTNDIDTNLSLEKPDEVESDWESDITSSLRKLISVAKLHYRKNNNGHVCGHRSNTNLKSRSTARNSKIQTYEQQEFPVGCNNEDLSEENVGDVEQSNLVHVSESSGPPHLTLFRRPSLPMVPMEHLYSQLDSLPKLKNRYTNRRSRRERLKQVVVQRKLSLLPNNAEGHQIVQLNIIPQGNQMKEQPVQLEEPVRSSNTPLNIIASSSNFQINEMDVVQNNIKGDTGCDLKKMDVIQEVANCEFISSDMDGIASTPSTSPSRILKESDNQWLNSEVADFSLSSFLGHLDCPSKSLLSVPVSTDDCGMNEDTMS